MITRSKSKKSDHPKKQLLKLNNDIIYMINVKLRKMTKTKLEEQTDTGQYLVSDGREYAFRVKGQINFDSVTFSLQSFDLTVLHLYVYAESSIVELTRTPKMTDLLKVWWTSTKPGFERLNLKGIKLFKLPDDYFGLHNPATLNPESGLAFRIQHNDEYYGTYVKSEKLEECLLDWFTRMPNFGPL